MKKTDRDQPEHFHGKSADQHIVEKLSEGLQLSHEPHGLEASGALIAIGDGATLAAFSTALLLLIAPQLSWPLALLFGMTIAGAYGARSCWIGASRLEKLHRLLEEENFEIVHHRDQERDELKALYKLKGFEEPLLTQLVDVLMADSDRLLKVMLEEELGLTLASHDHPLMMGAYSWLGTALSALTLVACHFSLQFSGYGHLGYEIGVASLICAIASALQAYAMGNDRLQAFICSGSASALFLVIAKLMSEPFRAMIEL